MLGSDHLAAVLYLSTKTHPFRGPNFSSKKALRKNRKLKWANDKLGDYQESLSKSRRVSCDFSLLHTEALYQNFCAALTEGTLEAGMSQIMGNFQSRAFYKIWFDEDCKIAKKYMKHSLKLLREFPMIRENVSAYLKSKKDYICHC